MKVNKTVLDNGICVISEEVGHVRSISVGIWVKCGSRKENTNTNGTAHFVEHMLFKGTESRSAFDIASAIDSVGGMMNAFTGKETTSFYITIPDYHLPLAIDLLADIFANSRFDQAGIGREKSVILQEIRMLEDSPDEYIHDLFEAVFWSDHPLALPILGTEERVQGFRRKSLVQFFQRHYRGANLILTAAGNLQHDVLADLAAKAFGGLGCAAVAEETAPPALRQGLTVMERDLEQVHIVIGAPAPSAVDPRRYAGLLMNAVLGGSMSSRLFQEIRENRGLAYEIQSYLIPYSDTGMLGVYVGTSREKVREVVGLIRAELRRMANELLTEKELRDVKELTKGNLLLGMESMDSRMARLARNEICYGRPVSADEAVERIDAVRADEIRSLAGEMFRPEGLSLAAMGNVTEEDLVAS